MINKFAVIFLLLLGSLGYAQNTSDVLFTIDQEPVMASEFVRVYKKNLDLVKDESQKDVDEYLKLFVNYKLKLKEAYALELDQKPSYSRELNNYKKQLAKNFLTDTKVTDELIQEAYERTVNEVNASHILVRVQETATPEDTLKAYNDILKLRERTVKEGFEKVQKEVHNGQTLFGEDLGYFSAFKMVYKFETAAYNTAVGDVSQPFRTRFGYHIVKVHDKRKSRGEVTVAHIMVANQKEGIEVADAEQRIQDIYQKLQQGEDFESLAKQFSDDNSSASNGGKLQPFSGGQLTSPEFESEAFGLEEIGDVTKPFETNFGWHIVKLYNKQQVQPFEVLKPELEVKVKRDSRSQLINNSLVNTLKQRYKVKEPDLSYFVSILNDDYYNKTWKLPELFQRSKSLVTIGAKEIKYAEFGDYLEKSQRVNRLKKPFKELVKELYDAFLSSHLMEYQEANLENENEDYANIVGEYRDGLLLFDLMESKIWNVAQSDSTQIEAYYNAHKDQYIWNERANAVVASSSNKSEIKEVAKMLKAGKTPDDIKAALNSENKVQVIFTNGMMEAGHQALPEDYKFSLGQSEVLKHNKSFVVVVVNKILPKSNKTLEEAKGLVISDYQNFKEQNWLNQLHNKYKVDINQAVLKQVKSQLK